jgi:hypothetical protein
MPHRLVGNTWQCSQCALALAGLLAPPPSLQGPHQWSLPRQAPAVPLAWYAPHQHSVPGPPLPVPSSALAPTSGPGLGLKNFYYSATGGVTVAVLQVSTNSPTSPFCRRRQMPVAEFRAVVARRRALSSQSCNRPIL